MSRPDGLLAAYDKCQAIMDSHPWDSSEYHAARTLAVEISAERDARLSALIASFDNEPAETAERSLAEVQSQAYDNLIYDGTIGGKNNHTERPMVLATGKDRCQFA